MTIGGIITAIVFGAIIGALGRLIVPGKQNMSIWLTVLVGIVAAFAGTGLSHLFGLKTHGWNFWETIFQVAIAALGVYLVAMFWPKKSAR
ncbi:MULTISPECIES: GlsB/YeaQ/YmgE family stress response membrane protein [Actinomadura]|uniref:GlsB/YeaQ/YmgE family stress response membrane protein n=1 Tax=Actinomadura yumaensis TaxID=111807 RepID=A0ABW2CWZ6_9ACTN|nr:GlsB/YeaQ/YmgE family stress response membrane protein [Actinomadura sp. J1-007]MWK39235.1 GlsB/YeaQ/YmgE family stress response membrane protein [Actinomadura sp. J1-007]